MKRFSVTLFLLAILLSLAGCGNEAAQPTEESKSPNVEKQIYEVGDVVNFGDYRWIVLDVQDNKALLLTEECIALDYINITEEARSALDEVTAKLSPYYTKLSDYEEWTVFTDDKVFPEGVSFYDDWTALLEERGNPLLDPGKLRYDTNWKDCSLRKKLNNDLLFTDEEWTKILETEVADYAGNNEVTYDKVFLLSSEQVEKYFPKTDDLGAKAMGISDEELLRCLKDLHICGSLSGTLAEYILDLRNSGCFFWWGLGESDSSLFGTHIGTEEMLHSTARGLPIAGVRPAIWISTESYPQGENGL